MPSIKPRDKIAIFSAAYIGGFTLTTGFRETTQVKKVTIYLSDWTDRWIQAFESLTGLEYQGREEEGKPDVCVYVKYKDKSYALSAAFTITGEVRISIPENLLTIGDL